MKPGSLHLGPVTTPRSLHLAAVGVLVLCLWGCLRPCSD